MYTSYLIMLVVRVRSNIWGLDTLLAFGTELYPGGTWPPPAGLSRYGEPPSGTERSSEDCTVEEPTSAGVFTERLIAEWGKNALGPVYALYMVLKCKDVSLSSSCS